MIKRVGTFIRIGVVAAVVLIGGGFGLYSYLQTQASVVIFDNPTHESVQLTVAGEDPITLNPGDSTVLELDEGSHEVVATAGGQELARETIEVGDGPFRGLYDVSGAGSYIVVFATYDAAGGSTRYQELPPGTRFRHLPSTAAREGLDQPFPSSVSTQGGGMTLTHVCRFDPQSEQIGCPGA